jgi:hypothetical protein
MGTISWTAKWVRLNSANLASLIPNNSESEVARFRADMGGSVLIMFSLTIFVIFSIVGGAVDYGRALLARERLQSAVDSSVLAAARIWQLENDLTLAKEKALAHFELNKPVDAEARVVSFAPNLQASTFIMDVEGRIETPFWSLLKPNGVVISARAEAQIGGGDNAGTHLEVSLMLDVTGSMAGSKIVDLKAAAKDLIDIVVWADQGEFTSRVALAPFSSAINAGAVLGPLVSANPPSNLKFALRKGNSPTRHRTNQFCLSERTGADAFTDAAPMGSNAIPRIYQTGNGIACIPSAPIVPLTSNKDALKAVIDSFVANGNTAGHLGTAWSWYLLSPNWADVLPAGGKPQPYSVLSQVGIKGQPLLKKIAVLMTDGEYNYQYCNSSTPNTTGASMPDSSTDSNGASCNSPNGTSTNQARKMCDAMKEAGITIYTVGFALGQSGSPVTTLRGCASEPHMFYNTQNGDELRNAFRHIATAISAPILSR